MVLLRRFLLMSSITLMVFSILGWSLAKAAPKAVLWERWVAHDPASTATIDHRAWQDLLQRYLITESDGINRFAYGEVTQGDRQKIDAYLEHLAQTPISGFSRPEQMAYWINLYNALTVQVILDHYPVKSIRDIDISPGLFSDGPWGKKLIMIEGEKLALDDIEHQILRPIWRDPRIHYAVNCASLGCPNLQPLPYDAAALDRQLDDAAIDFVNHRRSVELRGSQLIVSSIYKWFQDDFGNNDREVIAHLKAYASPDLAMKLERFMQIDGDDYDWRLNDATSG